MDIVTGTLSEPPNPIHSTSGRVDLLEIVRPATASGICFCCSFCLNVLPLEITMASPLLQHSSLCLNVSSFVWPSPPHIPFPALFCNFSLPHLLPHIMLYVYHLWCWSLTPNNEFWGNWSFFFLLFPASYFRDENGAWHTSSGCLVERVERNVSFLITSEDERTIVAYWRQAADARALDCLILCTYNLNVGQNERSLSGKLV